MKYFVAISYMLFIVFCVSGQLYSQDKTDNQTPDTAKNDSNSDSRSEVPQTQPKPAKVYDLTPKFYKHMIWKENIEFKMNQLKTLLKWSDSYIVAGDIRVTELKDNKPVKLLFDQFGGKGKTEFDFMGEDSVNDETFKPRDCKINVDQDYKLSGDFGDNFLFEELFVYYPAGNLVGFAVPTSEKSVGDRWSSDTFMPINYDNVKSSPEDVSLTDKKSNFHFISLNKVDEIEVATIIWTGSCTIQAASGTEQCGSISWKITTEFDLTNRRLISMKGKTTVFEGVEKEDKIELSLERTLKYENSESKKTDKEEIKPKPDEDE